MSTTPSEGPDDQDRRRVVLRAVSLLLVAVGVLLVGAAFADLAGAFDRTIDVVDVPGLPGEVGVDNGPGLFWLLFVGVPLGLVGAGGVLFSYLGAFPARPVQDGSCHTCGRVNDPDATFCDTCGTRLVAVA